MKKIKILSEELVGKIAAGEVVERPSSVVKELVENSIDAGADSVEIEVRDAGQSLIRVADNGEGMTREDAKLSCARHATSKISSAGDLAHINTLGFRGEALSSIAAVSHVDITTRNASEEEASYLSIESGEVQKMRPAARSRGTTVEVRNLFYNVPARRKFLKSNSSELASITEATGRFILSHPKIEFKLTHDGRILLHAVRGSGLIERIRTVLGGDVADHMLEIGTTVGKYRITGYVSRPSNTRKDRRAQLFFVNKRYIRSRLMGDAVQSSYKSLLERGRYPSAVLYVDADPSSVDVNIHPAKLLAKFEDERSARDAVSGAITAKFDEIKGPSVPQPAREAVTGSDREPAVTDGLAPEQEVQTEFEYERMEKSLPAEEKARRELFQVGKCYIARIGSDRITLIDQHAAHERILYEFFSKAAERRSAETQNLLFPIRLDLSADESLIIEKLLDEFRALGFGVEPFGEGSYAVQTVPAILKDRDIKTVILDVLSDLNTLNLAKIEPIDELVKVASCRAAIKAGDLLDEDEMSALISQLGRCDLPFTCPHGRPTSFEITLDEMEQRFRRK